MSPCLTTGAASGSRSSWKTDQAHGRVASYHRPLGEQDSLACPHVYDLSPLLAPGTHRLTVLIDNANKPPVGDPHQLSEHTQTNWNGIFGWIELRVTPPIWIEDVQVYPDIAARKARVLVSRSAMSTGKAAEEENWACTSNTAV